MKRDEHERVLTAIAEAPTPTPIVITATPPPPPMQQSPNQLNQGGQTSPTEHIGDRILLAFAFVFLLLATLLATLLTARFVKKYFQDVIPNQKTRIGYSNEEAESPFGQEVKRNKTFKTRTTQRPTPHNPKKKNGGENPNWDRTPLPDKDWFDEDEEPRSLL
jgi:hypothetical protein